jgi:dTDP-4-amino-4,6-dideoxygalactose transaminase
MLTQLERDEVFESALVGRGVVAEWERSFAEYCGVKDAFGTASGTMALYLALKAVGVKTGDEVIVPALDWYAATAAALHLGAIPVFADTEPNLPTVSPISVEESITGRTKAIVATHLFGYPCDMPALRSLADRHGIALIEDCAQALGVTCHGKRVGAWGDAACFSFGVGKALCCGEGGMIVTDRDDIAERILALATHPLRQEWEGIEVNPFALRAPLNPIAILHLLREWEQLEKRLAERCDAFDRINAVLAETKVLLPLPPRDDCQQSGYRFVALAPNRKVKRSVMIALLAAGLPVSDVFGAKLLPEELANVLRKGLLCWHPFPERLTSVASLSCPNAKAFLGRALVLDWRIGLDDEALNRLREILRNDKFCKRGDQYGTLL